MVSQWTLQVIYSKQNIYIALLLTVALHIIGNLYIADRDNQRIRKILVATSVISTIAGTGSASYSGDNGQATSAAINSPVGVAVDASGTC
jgi:trimeric autotransporter adhesin